ncbi:MAG: c-type cytochrome [Chloroflexi bacterium]|nr:c-type cytochrome [Chloroflexota bacterium]
MPSFIPRQLFPVFIIVALSVLAAACGSDEPTGDCLVAEDGAFVNAPCEVPPGVTAIPTNTPLPDNGGTTADPGFAAFRASGCAACHSVDGTAASSKVGPNLTTVGAKGEAYVRESILIPSAVVAEGFGDGIMPQTFGTTLSSEQIDSIVGWLISQ